MPGQTTSEHEWSARQLSQRLAAREPVYVLDLRSPNEYLQWRIETADAGDSLNLPMSEMLGTNGRDDPRAAVRAYADSKLRSRLPTDRPIAVVCARGISSVPAAEALQDVGYEAYVLAGGMQAWAALYDFRTVLKSPELVIYQCLRPARGCLSYIVASDGQTAIVDPLRHVDEYLAFVKNQALSPALVLDTHGHADHLSGGATLSDRLGVPYCLHPYDAIHPIDVLIGELKFEFLHDGQVLTIGRCRIKALHIPGHTLGNLAYLVNDRYLLTGDSIFIGSISRPDLGGRPETWADLHYRSLRRLLELPDDVLVLPGHFSSTAEADSGGLYAARLGDLKQTNPGLQMATKDRATFIDYILRSLPPAMPQYAEIKRVNAGLVTVNDDEAETLETGRNVCALAHAS